MNYELLHDALQNENNEAIYDLTFNKIKQMKKNILSQFDLSKTKEKEFLKQLEPYKYVDDLNDLRNGAYIRWIYIGDDENNKDYYSDDPEDFHLNKGALYCDIKIKDDGIALLCKTFNGSYFELLMNGDFLLFQKLSKQEMLILKAIEHIL
jgi:hypothetical protein